MWPGSSLAFNFLLHKHKLHKTEPLCLSLCPPTPVKSAPGGCVDTGPRAPLPPPSGWASVPAVIPLLPEPHRTRDVLYA